MLVRPGDLNAIFTVRGKQAVFSPIDGTEPPVTNPYTKRACGYTGTVPGIYTDQPVDGTSVTITVTTQVDTSDGGPAWQAEVWAGQMVGGVSPATALGHGAFYLETGHLVAHKGRVIVEVNPLDDQNNLVTNAVAEKLVKTALSRTAG